jgi:hypothetical protein
MKLVKTSFNFLMMVIISILTLGITPNIVSADNPVISTYLPIIIISSPRPILISPADGSTVNTLIPKLTFDLSSVTDYTKNILLEVYTPTKTAFSLSFILGSNPIMEEIPWNNLEPNTQYSWHVGVLKNDYQNWVWSEVYTFTTPSAPAYLAAPTLSSPANNSTVSNSRVDFSWSAIPGAKEYMLWVSDKTDIGNGQIIFTNGTTSKITADGGNSFLKPEHTYTWTVTARDDLAWGQISSEFKFTTNP